MLSFIISGHPDWKKSQTQIFDICTPDEAEITRQKMDELVNSGRLPITQKNINIIIQEPEVLTKTLINEKSCNASVTIIGIRQELVKQNKEKQFEGYDQIGTCVFVHSKNSKKID